VYVANVSIEHPIAEHIGPRPICRKLGLTSLSAHATIRAQMEIDTMQIGRVNIYYVEYYYPIAG